MPLDWQDVVKEKEQMGTSSRPMPAPAPIRHMSQYEVKPYDLKLVIMCQKRARTFLARRRFRRLGTYGVVLCCVVLLCLCATLVPVRVTRVH